MYKISSAECSQLLAIRGIGMVVENLEKYWYPKLFHSLLRVEKEGWEAQWKDENSS